MAVTIVEWKTIIVTTMNMAITLQQSHTYDMYRSCSTGSQLVQLINLHNHRETQDQIYTKMNDHNYL